MASKPRVVFDTNALISALILPKSVSAKALDLALEHCEVIVSRATWEEFAERIEKPSLMRYFGDAENRDHVVSIVNRQVVHISVQSTINDCRDPDDNEFLALALDGNAKVIVSGDKDLLTLHPWRGIAIVATGDFVRAIES